MSMTSIMMLEESQREERRRMGDENDRPQMRQEQYAPGRPHMPPMRAGWDEPNRMAGGGYFAWDNDNQQPARMGYDRPEITGGNITNMHDYQAGKNRHTNGKIGFGEQDEDGMDHGWKLTHDKAEKWVRNMRTTDDKPLQPISMAEAQRIAPNYGITGEHKMLEFWVVLNMMKSDYQTTGQKYASGAVDFYAGLAKDWLDDRDAVEDKMAMYKKYIVKKD